MAVKKRDILEKIDDLEKTLGELPEGAGKENALSILSDLSNVIDTSLTSEGMTKAEGAVRGGRALRRASPVPGDGLLACC